MFVQIIISLLYFNCQLMVIAICGKQYLTILLFLFLYFIVTIHSVLLKFLVCNWFSCCKLIVFYFDKSSLTSNDRTYLFPYMHGYVFQETIILQMTGFCTIITRIGCRKSILWEELSGKCFSLLWNIIIYVFMLNIST